MSCWSCWSVWTHSARQRGCVHALATQRRNKCQDTGSRFVGAVPRYRLDWIVLGYSRCQPLALIVRLLVVRVEASSFTDQAAPLAAQIRDAIGTPWCADGRQWRPPLANANVPPLAPLEPRRWFERYILGLPQAPRPAACGQGGALHISGALSAPLARFSMWR